MNWNLVLGVLLALAIGSACRWLRIPLPAPPTLYGVLLILAITVGYLAADKLLTK